MRNIKYSSVLFILFYFVIFSCKAQLYTKDSTKHSLIHVTTVYGRHNANNKVDKATLNAATGTFFCSVAVKDFDFGPMQLFQASTTVGRFLKAYMEYEKYPYIAYEGKLLNPNMINFSSDGTYEVQTEGRLTARGITRNMKIPITIIVKDKEVNIDGVFQLRPADDFKLRAETPIKYNYFKAVTVKIRVVLLKQ